MSAELFTDRLGFADRDPLDGHLGERRHQGLLPAPIARSKISVENRPLAILRNPQFELAHPGHQAAGLITAAGAKSSFDSLALFRADGFRHLRF